MSSSTPLNLADYTSSDSKLIAAFKKRGSATKNGDGGTAEQYQ